MEKIFQIGKDICNEFSTSCFVYAFIICFSHRMDMMLTLLLHITLRFAFSSVVEVVQHCGRLYIYIYIRNVSMLDAVLICLILFFF